MTEVSAAIRDEQKKHSKDIAEFIAKKLEKDIDDISVYPNEDSKQFVYIAEVDGDKYKARIYPFEPANHVLHVHLEKNTNIQVPKIVWVDNIPGRFLKVTRWIPGRRLHEAAGMKNDFRYVPDWAMKSWGKYMGRLHNESLNGQAISIYDMFWHNFIVTEKEEVICCDMSKLRGYVFPELVIYQWILFNNNMPDPKKEAFIDGYFSKRKVDLGHLLKSNQVFLDKWREAEGAEYVS